MALDLFPTRCNFRPYIADRPCGIPTLVNTGQLPESAQKLRIPLTGVAGLLFVVAVVILILGINAQIDVKAIYDRLLI